MVGNNGSLRVQALVAATLLVVAGSAHASSPRADFDGDGSNDVALWNPSTGDMKVKFGRASGTGNFAATSTGLMGTQFTEHWVGDFNNNGTTDIFAREPGTGNARLFYGRNPRGPMSPPKVADLPGGFDPVQVGDFDKDGADDLLMWNSSTGDGKVKWGRSNMTEGGWDATSNAFWGSNFSLLYFGDFNGDGAPDVFVKEPASGNARLIFARASRGPHYTPRTGSVPNGYDVKAQGDFDGDGSDDIIVWHPGTGDAKIKWGRTSGIGPWDSTSGSSWGTQFTDVHVGDYNGDGRDDIFIWEPGTINGRILYAQATRGPLGSPRVANIPSTTSRIFVGNFDSDASTDLLVYDSATGVGKIKYGRASGEGNFAITRNANIPTQYTEIQLGDFNMDGVDDFYAQNPNDQTGVLLFNGTTQHILGAPKTANVPAGYSVAIPPFIPQGGPAGPPQLASLSITSGGGLASSGSHVLRVAIVGGAAGFTSSASYNLALGTPEVVVPAP